MCARPTRICGLYLFGPDDYRFLASVDAPAVTREAPFLEKIGAILAANEVHVVEDLVGLDFNHLKEVPAGGSSAFIVRAIRKANAPPPAATTAPAAASEQKPHVDIVDKLSRRTLTGLGSDLLPNGEVVDDLALQLRK